MVKEIWINLPVKDVKASRAFFEAIGFSFNDRMSDNVNNACLLVGNKGNVVMLFAEPVFSSIIQQEITDTKSSNELIISFDGESKKEVDEVAAKVKAAGGHIFSAPAEVQGWMYGFAFTDPDGHRWNMLYMDMEAMPKQG